MLSTASSAMKAASLGAPAANTAAEDGAECKSMDKTQGLRWR